MSPQEVQKIVIIGDEGVGKSAFVEMVKRREFSHKYEPTAGAEVTSYEVDGKNLEIWDCGGKHVGLQEGYWIGAKVVVVMFAINSLLSWKNASEWLKNAETVAGDARLFLVGSKVDIHGVVDKGKVARGLFALRRKYPKLRYLECSAKIGYGCDEVMSAVAEVL
jgi:small GTP-binding protein